MVRESGPPTGNTLFAVWSTPDDPQHWPRFVDRYGPIILAWCRALGVNDADAEVITEDVLGSLFWKVRQYAPSLGRFRSWLRVVIRNEVSDFFRERKFNPRGKGGDSALEIPDSAGADLVEKILATERQEVLKAALDAVQAKANAKHWQCFWGQVVEGKSAADVAKETSMTQAAVFQAVCRVKRAVAKNFHERYGDEPLDGETPS